MGGKKKEGRRCKMTPEELRKMLEAKGYEVKRIRVFKNSFHVNYWTKEAKLICYCHFPIEKLTKQNMSW